MSSARQKTAMTPQTVENEEKKVCNEVMRIVAQFMPRLNLQPSNELSKIADQIVSRGINQPEMSREYVKVCAKICLELITEDSSLESSNKFKSSVYTSASKRFNEFINNKDLPLNVRLGTVRFTGEMFKFKLLTEIHIRNAMETIEKISKSSNDIHYHQYLFELIKITGYPPKPSKSVSFQLHTNIKHECPICTECYVNKTPVSATCGHIYCETCLVAHLRNYRSCPVCKTLLAINGFHRIFIG